MRKTKSREKLKTTSVNSEDNVQSHKLFTSKVKSLLVNAKTHKILADSTLAMMITVPIMINIASVDMSLWEGSKALNGVVPLDTGCYNLSCIDDLDSLDENKPAALVIYSADMALASGRTLKDICLIDDLKQVEDTEPEDVEPVENYSDTFQTIKASEEVVKEQQERAIKSYAEQVKAEQVKKEQELPDIITLDVKLYNDNCEGYNKEDGRAYLADIASCLDKHAVDGLLKSVACAMSYTEGGSGKSGVYVRSNNCFSIMATDRWDGYVYSRDTGDVYKNYETAKKYGATDLFRAYPNMEESVKDYVSLISGDYYKDVLNIDDPVEYIQFLLDKGYGEDSIMDVWLSIIYTYDLRQYDK